MTGTMNAWDAISSAMAECYVTIDGRRYNFMQAIDLEAKITKKKMQVPVLGKTGRGNKGVGWTGLGSAKFHYNTSVFRELLYRFKERGEDMYFDIQVTNEDPIATVGRQTVILKDCNLDSAVLAKFSAEEEYLDEEIRFTFEDFEIPEKFGELAGM
ncbi:MAG: phage tail tube protein [Firmicutes bacterium]|nr:phage tail tube protein [Bacillota bacterium]